jgi:hypothetical protein
VHGRSYTQDRVAPTSGSNRARADWPTQEASHEGGPFGLVGWGLKRPDLEVLPRDEALAGYFCG